MPYEWGKSMQWPHFNGGEQVKSPRQYDVYARGIPPKYREFVAPDKHSEVVGNSALKVL